MIRRVEKLPGIPKGTYQGQSVLVTPPGNDSLVSGLNEHFICMSRRDILLLMNMEDAQSAISGRAPLCLYTPTLRDSEAALLLPHGTSLIVYPFSTGSFQPYSSLDCRGIWDCLLRLRSRQYCPFTEKSKTTGTMSSLLRAATPRLRL
ncbi:hypothetical protein BKA60DRAFT_340884 [Fusarium oxysporum]|nr:hypothetical protein BKA60DRAFT_340884 [Fusarium oxysporum]